MLYAAGVPDVSTMRNAPHVGIASVWWEGNPCNMNLLNMGKEVKKVSRPEIRLDMRADGWNPSGCREARVSWLAVQHNRSERCHYDGTSR